MNLPRGAFRVWVVVSLIWVVFVGAVTFNEFKNAPASPKRSGGVVSFDQFLDAPASPKSSGGVVSSDEFADAPDTDIFGKIKKVRGAGYSDSDIAGFLKSSEAFAPKFKAAADAGYSDAEVYKHLGLNTPVDAPRASPHPQNRINYIPPYVKVLLEAVGIAAALPVALLVACVTLAWVVRGFRSDRP